jgi:hypothetical protein
MMSDGPGNLKGTLGSLFRTTLQQAGSFRQVLEREARSTRSWIEATRQARRKKDLLAELGLITYELAVRGELGDLAEYPELSMYVQQLDALEEGKSAAPSQETSASEEAAPPDWQPVSTYVQSRTETDDADLKDFMHEDDVPKKPR